MLNRDGTMFVSLDDNEISRLRFLMDDVFGESNFIASAIWQKVYSPKSSGKQLSVDHDYVIIYGVNGRDWRAGLLPRTEEADARYSNRDNDPRGDWKPSDLLAHNYYSKGSYEVISPSGKRFRNPPGTYWRVSPERFRVLDREKRIWWGDEGDQVPALKRFHSQVRAGLVPETIWPYEEVGHTQEAKKELMARVRFSRGEDLLNTVKPARLVQRILRVATSADEENHIMDFFAGSGTTGDAVMRQNRQDGGARRFLLVEQGGHFEQILLQRIKRAMYADEWKDLVPKRQPTDEEARRSPRLVKVLRLESYEDALHNLTTSEAVRLDAPRSRAHRQAVGTDAYRLDYVLRLPVESSPSMLRLERLDHPFQYELEVLTDSGPKSRKADLVETFNLVYGVHVRRRERWINPADERQYIVIKGHSADGTGVVIVWRDVDGLDPAVERTFLEPRLADEPPGERLINADSALTGFRSLDLTFKQLLEQEGI